MKRRGVELRPVIDGHCGSAATADRAVLKAIARARNWFDELRAGRVTSLSALAARAGVCRRYVKYLLPLAFSRPRSSRLSPRAGNPAEVSSSAWFCGSTGPPRNEWLGIGGAGLVDSRFRVGFERSRFWRNRPNSASCLPFVDAIAQQEDLPPPRTVPHASRSRRRAPLRLAPLVLRNESFHKWTSWSCSTATCAGSSLPAKNKDH